MRLMPRENRDGTPDFAAAAEVAAAVRDKLAADYVCLVEIEHLNLVDKGEGYGQPRDDDPFESRVVTTAIHTDAWYATLRVVFVRVSDGRIAWVVQGRSRWATKWISVDDPEDNLGESIGRSCGELLYGIASLLLQGGARAVRETSADHTYDSRLVPQAEGKHDKAVRDTLLDIMDLLPKRKEKG